MAAPAARHSVFFCFAERGVGRRVGQAHAEGFDSGGHGIGGVHSSAGAGAGAGIHHDAFEVGFVQVARHFLSKGFECGNDIEILSFVMTGGDGAAVYHDRGPVEATHGHDGAGHVLVTAGKGDEGVIILCAADCFDGVGDDVAADEGIAHAVGAIADAVADANGIEDEPHEVGVPDALFHEFGQVVQVHVAGVAVVAHADDSYLRLLKIVFRETDAV